ncbi:uncharacterized protein LOC141849250 [Brevipalpus obovatus]|uniref:uncharacterized protein LOC141849250 n=1 Tax=Brevipalpus obovatus TaxID=246614 RepID=UPI003D9E2AB1
MADSSDSCDLPGSCLLRSVPGTIIGLTGVLFTGLYGIQYFRRRKLNRAPSFPGNAIINFFRYQLNPDLLLEKSEQLTEQHGKIRGVLSQQPTILNVAFDMMGVVVKVMCSALQAGGNLLGCSLGKIPVINGKKGLGKCQKRSIIFVSDHGAAKDILQARDGQFREKPMFGWMEFVKTDGEICKPYDLWLSERKEIKREFKTFSLERSSSDQLEKFDRIISPTLKALVSLPTDESPSLSRSDLMLLTTNTLMEYLCGKRFHLKNERFNRFLDELDQLHENFVLKHVYLRSISEFVYNPLWYKKEYRERFRKAFYSADYIIKFLESDAGLIELRETMRENYSDGSYLDDSGLNFAQVLIKNHFKNPTKFSWDGCVKTVASLLSSASPISNMTMASLGYLSLDEESQNSICDEISQKLWEDQSEFIPIEKSMKLAVVRAVLMETYRMVSSPPILLTADENTSINGYDVDKGTKVIINIEKMNHSTELWEEPETFNPGRFLANSEDDPQILIVKKPSAYLPYTFGRKSQAMMSLLEHLSSNILANIINRFTIDSNHSRQEMAKSGLGPYKSIDMKNFFTVNLHKRA